MPFDYCGGIFEALPVEIWNLIIDFLRWDSWSSLPALNLACQGFHEIVSPVLFKTVHIHFPRHGGGDPKLDALLNPDWGRRVHHHVRILIVSHGHAFKGDYSELINTLVEGLPNLEIIRCRHTPFPPGLLSNLTSRHSPPVFYYEGDLKDLETINDRAAPFIKSASLTLNTVSARNVDADPHCAALRSLLPSLSNLSRLALQYRAPGAERSRPMLDLPPGSTLPSVEDLVLTNFSFSADQAASWTRLLEAGTRLRRLALDGTILDLCQFIHHLSSSGVPGGLRSFSLRVHDTSPRLTDSAAGVHDTSPRIPPQLSEAVTSLLHCTTNLTEFLAYDLPKHILHIVVSSHGGNIRRLTFRRTNFTGLQLGGPIHPPTGVTLLRESSAYKGSLFSPDEMQDFARRLPLLERLGIDLCFAGDLHLDILHAIASFPSLKFVELNTPHPNAHPHRRRRPSSKQWLDCSFAEKAFRHIADRKDDLCRRAAADGMDNRSWSRLMGLDIKEGEWEPLVSNYRLLRVHGRIYACWRNTAGAQGTKVHTLELPCKYEGYRRCIEDNMYEQTMIAAGLWATAHADCGPAIW